MKPFRILLIDDDEGLRQALPDLVELHLPSADVRTVASGQSAIDEVTRRDYDVVLCDLFLPGCHGADIARRIQQLRPETIVLLLTGHPRPGPYQELTGAFGYIRKPFERRFLVEVLKRLMRFCRLKNRLVENGRAKDQRVRVVRSFEARLRLMLLAGQDSAAILPKLQP